MLTFFSRCILLFIFLPCLSFSRTLPIVVQDFPPVSTGKIGFGVKETTEIPTPNRSSAKIRPVCKPAWIQQVDPLVSPGKPKSDHIHIGFGNTSITEFSDLSSLINVGNSTCTGGTAIRSAGWVPAMVDSEKQSIVLPSQNMLYYFSGYTNKAWDNMTAIPNGMRMLAGDSMNNTPVQSIFKTKNGFYQCLNFKTGKIRVSFGPMIVCESEEILRIVLAFPNCAQRDINGNIVLDSPNHKDHLAYSGVNTFNECPKTHPVRLLQVSFNIDYKVPKGETSKNWWLSSDDMEAGIPGASLHGDWVHADDKHVQDMIVNNLLRNPTPSDGGIVKLGLDPADGKYKALFTPLE